MTEQVVSKSEAIKEDVLAAIQCCEGGVVQGYSYQELRSKLFSGDLPPMRVFKSALWKLKQSGKIKPCHVHNPYYGPHGCEPRYERVGFRATV